MQEARDNKRIALAPAEAEVLSLKADLRKLGGVVKNLKVAKGDTSRFFSDMIEATSIATYLEVGICGRREFNRFIRKLSNDFEELLC